MLTDHEYNLLDPLGDQIRVWVGLAGLNYGTRNYGASVGGVWYPCLNDMTPSDQYMKNLNSGTHAPGPTRYLTYRSTSDEQLEDWTMKLDGARIGSSTVRHTTGSPTIRTSRRAWSSSSRKRPTGTIRRSLPSAGPISS